MWEIMYGVVHLTPQLLLSMHWFVVAVVVVVVVVVMVVVMAVVAELMKLTPSFPSQII